MAEDCRGFRHASECKMSYEEEDTCMSYQEEIHAAAFCMFQNVRCKNGEGTGEADAAHGARRVVCDSRAHKFTIARHTISRTRFYLSSFPAASQFLTTRGGERAQRERETERERK